MSIYIDNTYLHCFHSFIKVLSCNIKNFTYPENLRIINDKKFLQDKGTGIKVKHIQHKNRVYGYQHSSWVTYRQMHFIAYHLQQIAHYWVHTLFCHQGVDTPTKPTITRTGYKKGCGIILSSLYNLLQAKFSSTNLTNPDKSKRKHQKSEQFVLYLLNKCPGVVSQQLKLLMLDFYLNLFMHTR